jgi:hypothetical protein
MYTLASGSSCNNVQHQTCVLSSQSRQFHFSKCLEHAHVNYIKILPLGFGRSFHKMVSRLHRTLKSLLLASHIKYFLLIYTHYIITIHRVLSSDSRLHVLICMVALVHSCDTTTPLKPKFVFSKHWLRIQSVQQRNQHFSITKINSLILFKETNHDCPNRLTEDP